MTVMVRSNRVVRYVELPDRKAVDPAEVVADFLALVPVSEIMAKHDVASVTLAKILNARTTKEQRAEVRRKQHARRSREYLLRQKG